MPQKAATIKPLKAGLWYARTTRPVFDLGPYPSLEDALNDLPDAVELMPGDAVEIGQLEPFEPEVRGILADLAEQAYEFAGPVSEPWGNTLDALVDQGAATELLAAMELVLWGWLAQHEANPNFGRIGGAEKFVWSGDRLNRNLAERWTQTV